MRLRVLLATLLFLSFGTVFGGSCPYCAYTPGGFGFCKGDGWFGVADCSGYVADPWTGRTDCDSCGTCDPQGVNAPQGCGSGEGGPLHPVSLRPIPCGIGAPDGKPVFVAGGENLSWVGARARTIAIF